MANTALWEQVEKTDPKHVKEITGKSYRGNSPKPHYLVHKATETFGPCGIGWGFKVLNERIIENRVGEAIHQANVLVWYVWEGERGEIEHVGATSMYGTRKDGKPYIDEDAPKKSVTDALVKALSMIGFAGDIFMGRYDDSKYVNDLRREIAEAEQGAPPEPPEAAHVEKPYWGKAGAKDITDDQIAFLTVYQTALAMCQSRGDIAECAKANHAERVRLKINDGGEAWKRLRAMINDRSKQIEAEFQATLAAVPADILMAG
jgi:hypothetical protein